MFGSLFRRKKASEPVYVTARLNARLQPLDRGDVFEDPLDELLQAAELGEITGGGTQMAEDIGIEFCDLELALKDADQGTLTAIAAMLDGLGAPKGSRLIPDGGGPELEFGKAEGLALHLNGVDLDPDIYETCDFGDFTEECDRLLDGTGRYMSYWQGESETAAFFYGENAEQMRQRLAPYFAEYPLCQKSRVEQIV